MKFSTTKLRKISQPEISFELHSDVSGLGQWLVDYFESQAAAGGKFEDGCTLEIGWSLLLLRQVDDHIEVFEPDFDASPIRWCGGVNNTIRHLYLQRAVCDLFACEPSFPSLRQAGIASPMFADSERFVMSRDVSIDQDSGWVFHEADYAGDEGEYDSLYNLAIQKIAIVPFLALPAASQVLITPDFCQVTSNRMTKSSKDCDLLKVLHGESILV